MKKKVMLRLLAIIDPHTVPVVRHCNKKTLQAVLFHAAKHQAFQRSFAENCDAVTTAMEINNDPS